MKLADFLLLSLSAALVIIGTHLTITSGILASYPVLMFAVALLFWYKFRKNKIKSVDSQESNGKKMKNNKKKNK